MKLDESLGFLINNAGRKMSQLLTTQFAPYNITTEQWTLLIRLAELDGISQKELAAKADKDPTNVTRILDQLERKNLIVRKANLEDKRSFLVYITGEGKEINQKLTPIEADVINQTLGGLSADHIQLLKKSLRTITENANQLLHK